MLCQRSRISSNTGGIRRCGSKRIRIPDSNKYKTKHTITKFCNLKIRKLNGLNPCGMLKMELVWPILPNCLRPKMVRWICQNGTDVRDYVYPRFLQLTIVGWRPLPFGWRPFMVCIPNATSKVTPMDIARQVSAWCDAGIAPGWRSRLDGPRLHEVGGVGACLSPARDECPGKPNGVRTASSVAVAGGRPTTTSSSVAESERRSAATHDRPRIADTSRTMGRRSLHVYVHGHRRTAWTKTKVRRKECMDEKW